MAKLVFKSLNNGKKKKAAPAAVGKKRVAKPEGGWKIVRTLDANSAAFEAGLTYVFQKNVAKARRENKRVTGAADIVPAKS